MTGMPHIQPVQVSTGYVDGANKTVRFPPSLWAYSILNLNIQGQSGKTVTVYIGTQGDGGYRDSTQQSSNNTASYLPGEMIVNPGSEVFIVWAGAAAYTGVTKVAMSVTEDF